MICRKSLIYFIIPLFVVNCSYYSFKGTTPSHIKSVTILPIINKTSQGNLSIDISNNFNDLLIKENILEILDLYESDSKITLTIKSVSDKPNVFSSDGENYEEVEEWKLMINVQIEWYDLKNNEIIISKNINEWAIYSAFGTHIDSDNIDNDLDGLIDEQDSDEFGAPREGALRICIENISKRIINELTSTW